jgi:hypothetical protein
MEAGQILISNGQVKFRGGFHHPFQHFCSDCRLSGRIPPSPTIHRSWCIASGGIGQRSTMQPTSYARGGDPLQGSTLFRCIATLEKHLKGSGHVNQLKPVHAR